ncbi:hypothetical protein AB0D35_13040 [Streptomyces sp. NPDC048301]
MAGTPIQAALDQLTDIPTPAKPTPRQAVIGVLCTPAMCPDGFDARV